MQKKYLVFPAFYYGLYTLKVYFEWPNVSYKYFIMCMMPAQYGETCRERYKILHSSIVAIPCLALLPLENIYKLQKSVLHPM